MNDLIWDKKNGLRIGNLYDMANIPYGTFHRYVSYGRTRWRMRVKRRRAGLTWTWLPDTNPMVKRIKLEMLLMGIS